MYICLSSHRIMVGEFALMELLLLKQVALFYVLFVYVCFVVVVVSFIFNLRAV
jgi:hypothetical protein